MSPFEQHPVHQAASLHRGLRRRLVSAYQPERLEPRLALAGVVGLVVTGDVLTITGDALANELRIDQVAPNQIRVAPIHDKFLPTNLRDARAPWAMSRSCSAASGTWWCDCGAATTACSLAPGMGLSISAAAANRRTFVRPSACSAA